jgi:hypothetical protein
MTVASSLGPFQAENDSLKLIILCDMHAESDIDGGTVTTPKGLSNKII